MLCYYFMYTKGKIGPKVYLGNAKIEWQYKQEKEGTKLN